MSDADVVEEIMLASNTGPGGEHYRDLGTLEFIEAQGWWGFHKGCIAKYLARYQEKGGVSDLEKARFYLERLIEHERKG